VRKNPWTRGAGKASMILLLLLWACDREPKVAETDTGGITPVLVEQARKGPFRVERRFTGEVRASGEIRVTAREPGTLLDARLPKNGSPIVKGQVLLRLQSKELELQLREAQFYFEQSGSALERYQDLRDKGLVPLLEYEEKRSIFEAAKARLDQLKLRESNLTVTAPSSGLATYAQSPVAGQYMEPGTEILRLMDPRQLMVEVVIPSGWASVAGDIKTARITLPDGKELAASPVSFSSEVEANRGGRVLRLKPEDTASLFQGEVLEVHLILVSREGVVTVPLNALEKTEEGYSVLKGPAAGSKGRVHAAKVLRGPDDGERVVIESGLEGGTWVVLGSVSGEAGFYRTFLGVGK